LPRFSPETIPTLDLGRRPAERPDARIRHRHGPYRIPSIRPASRRALSFQETLMAIPDHAHTNFNTLLRAAGDGNLALMECLDAASGERRYVLCAVGRDGGDVIMTPFGHLADGNPYDAYRPPDPMIRQASSQPNNAGARHDDPR
jgi:hypothetical protein